MVTNVCLSVSFFVLLLADEIICEQVVNTYEKQSLYLTQNTACIC